MAVAPQKTPNIISKEWMKQKNRPGFKIQTPFSFVFEAGFASDLLFAITNNRNSLQWTIESPIPELRDLHNPEKDKQKWKECLKNLRAEPSMFSIRCMGYILSKFWRKLFHYIVVDEERLLTIHESLSETKLPVLLLPTHKSHIDYLVLSYIWFSYGMQMPFIAAGENLDISLIGRFFRKCGAFFIKRRRGDEIYDSLLQSYLEYLLKGNNTIEFFIEGGRSRFGKIASPKLGLLSKILDLIESGKIQDVLLVPISIDYDRPLELHDYARQLLGRPKKQESLYESLRAGFKLLRHTKRGGVYVSVGQPMSAKQCLQESKNQKSSTVCISNFLESSLPKTESESKSWRDLDPRAWSVAQKTVWQMQTIQTVTPSILVAALLFCEPHMVHNVKELEGKMILLLELIHIMQLKIPNGMVNPRELLHAGLRSISEFTYTFSDNVVILSQKNAHVALAYLRNELLHSVFDVALVVQLLIRNDGSMSKNDLEKSLEAYKALFQMEICIPPLPFNTTIETLRKAGIVSFGSTSVYKSKETGEIWDVIRVEEMNTAMPSEGNFEDVITLNGDARAKELSRLLSRFVSPFLDSYWLMAFTLHALVVKKGTNFDDCVSDISTSSEDDLTMNGLENFSTSQLNDTLYLDEKGAVRLAQCIGSAMLERRNLLHIEGIANESLMNALKSFHRLGFISKTAVEHYPEKKNSLLDDPQFIYAVDNKSIQVNRTIANIETMISQCYFVSHKKLHHLTRLTQHLYRLRTQQSIVQSTSQKANAKVINSIHTTCTAIDLLTEQRENDMMADSLYWSFMYPCFSRYRV